MTLHLKKGFAPTQRAKVASLFWAAFSEKLHKILTGDVEPMVADALNPDFCLCVENAEGTLLGAAGFQTHSGTLFELRFHHLKSAYGLFGAIWRSAILALLERKTSGDLLVMDGIFVDEQARGQGIGTQLLAAIDEEAKAQGKRYIRLDVIDINPRAKALYERCGYKVVKTEHLGLLRHIFGFRTSYEMRKDLGA